MGLRKNELDVKGAVRELFPLTMLLFPLATPSPATPRKRAIRKQYRSIHNYPVDAFRPLDEPPLAPWKVVEHFFVTSRHSSRIKNDEICRFSLSNNTPVVQTKELRRFSSQPLHRTFEVHYLPLTHPGSQKIRGISCVA